ncbi:hypothetical protein SDC9_96232 [bioreactor metagenome]|uniref:Uncharacterized protein n=1 Tax=bioreactor metagenome TaxID=1076179 RepID=A0A645A8Q0_9ZZZZ
MRIDNGARALWFDSCGKRDAERSIRLIVGDIRRPFHLFKFVGHAHDLIDSLWVAVDADNRDGMRLLKQIGCGGNFARTFAADIGDSAQRHALGKDQRFGIAFGLQRRFASIGGIVNLCVGIIATDGHRELLAMVQRIVGKHRLGRHADGHVRVVLLSARGL